MNKFKTYLLIAIFSLISFVAGLTINSTYANKNAIDENMTYQTVQYSNDISYKSVYVNGTKYTIFMGPTGDIEVVR